MNDLISEYQQYEEATANDEGGNEVQFQYNLSKTF
jgi:hypothetical protein